MARLYSNENFPLPVVEKLRALGHNVLTIQETGKADQAQPDDKVLEFATAENRAVSLPQLRQREHATSRCCRPRRT